MVPEAAERFYSSIGQMRALAKEPLLIDVLPTHDPHNIRARILRHGLTVSAFSSLEKYLGSRFEAVVSDLPQCGLSFADFDSKLKKLLSVDAVIGLATKISLRDNSEQQAFTEEKLGQLSRYAENPANYTALGFSPKGSNVAESDVSKFLSAFGVENPWDRLGSIAQMIGASRINLRDDFLGLSKARHRSAHNPDSNVATSDLETHLENVVIIAVSVDILAVAIKKALRQLPRISELKVRMTAWPHRVRFVDEEFAGTWVERAESTSQVIKRYLSQTDAIEVARSRKKVDIVIVRDTAKIPIRAA